MARHSSRLALALILLFAPSLWAQGITIEKAEVLTQGEQSAVKVVATFNLPAGTIVEAEVRRGAASAVGTHRVEGPGKAEVLFGPHPGVAEIGLYQVALVARRAKQTQSQVTQTWEDSWGESIEAVSAVLVGDPQEAEKIRQTRQDAYVRLMFRYGGWYQQMTGRLEGAMQRAREIEGMAKSDPMALDHFRKTMWTSTKQESDVGNALLKPVRHDFLKLKKEESDRFAPIFGDMIAKIAGIEGLLEEWFGHSMKEAQATYEQLFPEKERQLKEPPQAWANKRKEVEQRIANATRDMYSTLGTSQVANVWTMKESNVIERGFIHEGVYKNVSCRFHVGPLPPGLRFNIFSTDPSTRVYFESEADPKSGKIPEYFVGAQGAVIVRQFAQPLAPDAFVRLMGTMNEGITDGKEVMLPDKLMPGNKRRSYAFTQKTKHPGTPARPAGDYEGAFHIVYGRDMRTVYIVSFSTQAKHWGKVAPMWEEIWKTFRIRDEEPAELIQFVPR